MPTYKLKHGAAHGDADCGGFTVSQAGGQTTVTANPPGGGAPTNITNLVAFTPKAGTNDTLMNPGAGDTINLGTYTVIVSQVLYTFSTNATYQAAGNGKKAGYYTQPGLTGGLDDWEAADSGTPEE